MIFSEKVPFIVIMLCSNNIYTSCAVIKQPHVTSDSIQRPELQCPSGQFVYRIPAGIYTNDNGVDQSIDPGFVCRQCQICPVGAEVVTRCKAFTDTVCGGCVKEGYVFDEGTKSCQPWYIVEGRQEGDKKEEVSTLPREEVMESSPDCDENPDTISSADVDALFVASVTLFVAVVSAVVVLVIIATVASLRKSRRNTNLKSKEAKTSKGSKGRNLPTITPNLVFSALEDTVKQKKGYTNLAHEEEDEHIRPN